MRQKRKPSAEDGIPVVTYSRLPGEREAPDAGPHALRDAEPWLDGVEVPLVGRQPRPRGAAPDIRADAYDDPPPSQAAVADLLEPKPRRPRLISMVAIGALVALVAGFGILVLTFHAATTVTVEAPAVAKDPQAEIADLQKQIDALANSAGPANEATRAKIAELEARLADMGTAKASAAADATPAPPAIRTIPTSASDAAPAADAAPPPPRARPPKKEARAQPDAAMPPVAAPKAVVPVTAVVETPAAARAEPKVAEVPPARAKTVEGAPTSDADFIARVEKAIAAAPPERAVSPVPPRTAAAPAGALAPADEEPSGIAAAGGAPNDIGPAIRVIPQAGVSADARPVFAAPADGSPITLDIPPAPGTPVPPEPIPSGQ